MKTIVVATIKGGVGKTILSTHLAAALARLGRKTLLMDLDPQSHASALVGFALRPDVPCVGDTLLRESGISLDEVIVHNVRDNLDLAPSSLKMAAQERQLHAWALRLKTVLRALRSLHPKPEVVVIDCPPNVGCFTEAALHAADLTIAPVPPLAGSLKGLIDLRTLWEEMRDGREGQLVGSINLWDSRTSVTNNRVLDLLERLGTPILSTRVPKSEIVNQAALRHHLVFDKNPDHPLCQIFTKLAEEVWAIAQQCGETEDWGEMREEVPAWLSTVALTGGFGISPEAYLADASYSVIQDDVA